MESYIHTKRCGRKSGQERKTPDLLKFVDAFMGKKVCDTLVDYNNCYEKHI